jgi:hypothetical protein
LNSPENGLVSMNQDNLVSLSVALPTPTAPGEAIKISNDAVFMKRRH